MSDIGAWTPQEPEDTTEIPPDQYDVAILGGGMAGLTLALQLTKARPATHLLVVEKQKHPVPEAAHKVGESTVEIAAHYLRDVLGLEEHLRTQQLPKFGLRMFFSADGNQDIARRVELGHAVLPPRRVATYQLDRGRLENALGSELIQRGIPFLDSCKVQQVTLQPQSEYHHLQILHNGINREIKARWIVDASGRSTLLQRQLGLAKKVDHNANAVWFRVGYPIDINEWSNDPAWLGRVREGERRLSTNHLMGPGYWVWLIPLASGSTSIGIVTDANMHAFEEMNLFERALTWLHEHEPQCAEAVEQHREKVQDFRVMKNYSYSCEQVFSDERWCLVGEAGVSLDPLYSPGGDLIAIANGLACDLISHALDGEDIEEQAAIHNQVFLTITNSWRSIYEQQYPIMGNAQIMAAKVIWDTAVYWAVPGLLYFHDKIRSLAEHLALFQSLARLVVLSEHIQAFFREWAAIEPSNASDIFIQYYDFEFSAQLQIGMTAELDDSALEAQMAANIRFLEQLGGQLASTVIEAFAMYQENETIQKQVQRWKADPYLAELMTLYQQVDAEHPINGGWITLGRQKQEQQEIAR
jgi:2-polyprenyl-6-methoxyphenol hydroxylase-like FAD-dependent oxidoreductase